MSDDESDSTVAQLQWVPLVDAARALDLTSDAIRARLRRGAMRGMRSERGEWLVAADEIERATGRPVVLSTGQVEEKERLELQVKQLEEKAAQRELRIADLEARLEELRVRLRQEAQLVEDLRAERRLVVTLLMVLTGQEPVAALRGVLPEWRDKQESNNTDVIVDGGRIRLGDKVTSIYEQPEFIQQVAATISSRIK